MSANTGIEQATLGGGCFWCTEAVFAQLKGISLCESGYSGGATPNPSYESVCSGKTGHAEVIRLQFDPQIISFREILAVFFATHDPTTLNRQGNDIGTQYRSVIFFHSLEQRDIANQYIQELEEQKVFRDKIVTEISPIQNYFPAEKIHQQYFENNTTQSYCAYVVAPKVEKAQKLFGEILKRQ